MFNLKTIGCKLVPHFDTYSNWRDVRIVSRMDGSNPSTSQNVSNLAQSLPRSHPWDPSVVIRSVDSNKHTESKYNCTTFNANDHLFL